MDILGDGSTDILVSHRGASLVWSENGTDWHDAEVDISVAPDEWGFVEIEGGYLAEWRWNMSVGYVASVDGKTWYAINRPERLGDSVDVTSIGTAAVLSRVDFDGQTNGLWFGTWSDG